MKDKRKDQSLIEAYNNLMNLMLHDFPANRIHEIVAEDVTGYGTTGDEKILDIVGLKKVVNDQRTQGRDKEIQFNVTPVKRKKMASGNAALFVDEIVITIPINGASKEIPIRLSSLFEYVDGAWKVVYLHGSVAESTDKDTWHMNEWWQKNAELQKLLDEKTAELTRQNRELEIEAALEMVRNRSMAMQKSEELKEVVKVVFDKLQELNFPLEDGAVSILVFKEDSNSHTQWIADPDRVYINSFEVALTKHSMSTDIINARKTGLDCFSKIYSVDEKNDYFKYLFEHNPEYRKLPDEVKKLMLESEHYGITVAYARVSAILIPTNSGRLLTEPEKEILKRFVNVFDQTYTRFLDLQKAETQAREAQIEAALERIRSRTMAMHKSDELKDVVVAVFEKLKDLGLTFEDAGIQLYSEGSKDIVQWVAAPDLVSAPVLANLPYAERDHKESELIRDIWAAKENGKSIHNKNYSFDEKNKFFEYAGRNNDITQIPADVREFQMKAPGYTQTLVAEKHSALWVDSYSGQTISVEEFNVLKRFAKVFEQAYTRFLDLQKAESQAREAQVEAALERVRSRSMGMQKSEDLREVVRVLYAQLSELDFQWGAASIIIMDPFTGDIDWWMEGFGAGYDLPEKYHVPYFDHRGHKEQLVHWKNGTPYAVINISGREKKSFDKYYFTQTDFLRAPEATKSLMMQQETVLFSMAYMAFGALAWSPNTLSDEQAKILQRFAKVFEQSYTRFLDLQKAEAQAREAQIEAALEKVRNVSLAMQKSSELQNVIVIVFEKLRDLGLKFEDAGISIYQEGTKDTAEWVAAPGQLSAPVFVNLPFSEVDFEESEIFRDFWNLREKGEPMFNKTYSFVEKNNYFKYVGKYNDFSQVPAEVRKFQLEAPGYIVSAVTEKNSGIWVDSWSGQKITKEDLQVLVRVARVFEQAYTRFLDLQKSEAQTREAQIQLALERVRARTMAMHHSSELADAATILFDQLKQLGAELWTCGFAICDRHKDVVEKWMTSPSGQIIDQPLLFPISHPEEKAMYEAWKNGVELTTTILGEEDLRKSFENLITLPFMKKLMNDFVESGVTLPTWTQGCGVNFTHGYLLIITTSPFEETPIFIRFAKVFEQTYTRFLDLQKAEAQAREAQIEAALEKVRGMAMGMHNSSDLSQTVNTFFKELKTLGIVPMRCGVGEMHEATKTSELVFTTADKQGELFELPGKLFHEGHPIVEAIFNHWQKQAEYHPILDREEMSAYYKVIRSQMELPPYADFTRHYGNYFYFRDGFFFTWGDKPLSEEGLSICRRFTSVLSLTYKRYKELHQAEAQARESQIQLAMERVRARTMAMQRSDELSEAASLLFQQVQSLEAPSWTAGYCIWDEDKKAITLWMSSPSGGIQPPFRAPLDENPTFIRYLEADKKGIELYIEEESGKVTEENYQYLFTLPVVGELLNAAMKEGYPLPTYQVDHCAYFSKGFLLFITYQQVPELYDIFKRFAKVFEQTYTRFLDLQKAEAQAREAQIEAALERVRSRSMAMHRSEELSDVILTVSVQLQELGFRFDNVSFVLNTEAEDYDFWFSIPGQLQPHHIHVPYIDNPINNRAREARSKGLKFFADIIDPLESRAWHQHMFNHNQMDFLSAEAKAIVLKSGYARSVAIMNSIMLVLGNYASKPYREEDNSIIRRFATVFEQTYTRFLDLKKVEGQAKEAQIEAALEKVRSRSLAMHHSDELEQVVLSLFDRLVELGLSFDGALIFAFDREKPNFRHWIATKHLATPVLIDLPLDEEIKHNAIIKDLWNAIQKGKHIFNKSYTGETKNEYFRYVARNNESKVPESVRKFQLEAESWTTYFVAEKNSIVGFDNWSGPITTITDSDFQILLRFAKVFDQAYIRFLDLQKAEAREREAIKQASLDRVRAEIASMRTANDLNRITPLVWRELTTLGVPFFRCGIFIVDHEAKKIDSYLSNPEGEALAAWRSDYDTIPLFTESVKAWEKQQVYTTEWNKQQFIEFSQRLVGQGLIRDVKRYQAGEVAPEHLSLHMIPFRQGMLYVGSAEKLNNDQIELAQALASSFSVAYSRFEDFRQLEKAKSEVEYTLSELKSTQTQLIHAEKMASLGELTAGIAHEIQNPLNFVNNFSEVSKEMIEELKAERQKVIAERDEGLEEELLNDINENLQKIHHHGQRASGIVKGMLQHSRTSSGQKESTNINSLADEYLRLAYHGFRAKDKSFNANFKTDLDPTLPNINVVGQDIGRVLLNLINNAFYAVSAKSKRGVEGYEPTVTVRTKRINHSLEIRVKDNGDGIPANVINKIFQPFFTTKPTGEGTGLGLSLSYDIITKGHNGSLEVDTTEGVGTEFIVKLPMV